MTISDLLPKPLDAKLIVLNLLRLALSPTAPLRFFLGDLPFRLDVPSIANAGAGGLTTLIREDIHWGARAGAGSSPSSQTL